MHRSRAFLVVNLLRYGHFSVWGGGRVNISLNVCTFAKQMLLWLRNRGPPHHGTRATATFFEQLCIRLLKYFYAARIPPTLGFAHFVASPEFILLYPPSCDGSFVLCSCPEGGTPQGEAAQGGSPCPGGTVPSGDRGFRAIVFEGSEPFEPYATCSMKMAQGSQVLPQAWPRVRRSCLKMVEGSQVERKDSIFEYFLLVLFSFVNFV